MPMTNSGEEKTEKKTDSSEYAPEEQPVATESSDNVSTTNPQAPAPDEETVNSKSDLQATQDDTHPSRSVLSPQSVADADITSASNPTTSIKPSTETPSAETPSAETPSAETPSAETPSAETPSAETPSAETPSTETETIEAPSTKISTIEAPTPEAPGNVRVNERPVTEPLVDPKTTGKVRTQSMVTFKPDSASQEDAMPEETVPSKPPKIKETPTTASDVKSAPEVPDKRSTPLSFGGTHDNEPDKPDTAILSENNSSVRRIVSSQNPNLDSTASLGNTTELILVIRGMIERIILNPDIKYKLGRFDIGTKGLDEIDLTPYGALDRGVSRIHAEMFVKEQKLYITDLDSTNGTYMAGERLKPNDPVLLRKGDELVLGRLPIQVMFRQPTNTSYMP